MDQWVKLLSAVLEVLCLVPRTHMMKELNPRNCPLSSTHIYAHTQRQITISNKRKLIYTIILRRDVFQWWSLSFLHRQFSVVAYK